MSGDPIYISDNLLGSLNTSFERLLLAGCRLTSTVRFRPIVLKKSNGNNFGGSQMFNHFEIVEWRRFW
jgi:hypothetical protein